MSMSEPPASHPHGRARSPSHAHVLAQPDMMLFGAVFMAIVERMAALERYGVRRRAAQRIAEMLQRADT
jgi:hypothetical protein